MELSNSTSNNASSKDSHICAQGSEYKNVRGASLVVSNNGGSLNIHQLETR